MKALVSLLLMAVAVFSMISFFSGTSFSNFFSGVASVENEDPDKNQDSSTPSEWKSMVENGNAQIAILEKYIEQYDTGDNQEETKQNIEKTLMVIIELDDQLENEEDKLSGDELKEFRVEYRLFKKKAKQIQKDNSIVKEIVDKINNVEKPSANEESDHFFGD
ncbi:MAG: hypothetical protein A2014_02585 [Spirochaetes bacterium GWF1_49_6]|jgi:hypothetical protein|nr:MAG: hypothetical protein A2014_02585 [Spirochaetes bacterium GWF1_49_6]